MVKTILTLLDGEIAKILRPKLIFSKMPPNMAWDLACRHCSRAKALIFLNTLTMDSNKQKFALCIGTEPSLRFSGSLQVCSLGMPLDELSAIT